MSSPRAPRPYQIRDARAYDVPKLQQIELDAARRYGDFSETRFCMDLPARDEAEHKQARENGFAFVVEVSETPVGFILVVPKDARAHILEIAVTRLEQGRGYGCEMIAIAEAWATAAGFREMTLTTFLDVPWNAPFYAKIGYEIFEVGHDRPELTEVIAQERRLELHKAKRVAMFKKLPIRRRMQLDRSSLADKDP